MKRNLYVLAGLGVMTVLVGTSSAHFLSQMGLDQPLIVQAKTNDVLVSADLESVTFKEAISWMAKQNLNFIVDDGIATRAKTISLHLHEVPGSEAIEAICAAFGVEGVPHGKTYVIRNSAISFEQGGGAPNLPLLQNGFLIEHGEDLKSNPEFKSLKLKSNSNLDLMIKSAAKEGEALAKMLSSQLNSQKGVFKFDSPDHQNELDKASEELAKAEAQLNRAAASGDSQAAMSAGQEALRVAHQALELAKTRPFPGMVLPDVKLRFEVPESMNGADGSLTPDFLKSLGGLGGNIGEGKSLSGPNFKLFIDQLLSQTKGVQPNSKIKVPNGQKLVESLTPKQHALNKSRGYLLLSDLNASQKQILGNPAENVEFVFKTNEETIKVVSKVPSSEPTVDKIGS